MDRSTNNKRIVKNTFMLYVRMLLSVVVSLYTSRVILNVLGVEDYGVYGVVAGVVAMFSFLNSTMASATSRFLSYEVGKYNKRSLKETFCSALIIHLGIALLIVILVESLGLWFLNNKLIIPEERILAAHWVFHLSLLGMIVGITQVPYNAVIIAHENMSVYAYVELIHVFLQLGIVFLLEYVGMDKLVLYSILMLLVKILVAVIYRCYCLHFYEETRGICRINKEITRKLLSFSTYNLLGNMGSIINTQGLNIVINIFFGVLYNAASSIAITVSGVITGFASNIMTAFKPQIISTYAKGDLQYFKYLLSWALKTILFAYAIIALPVFLLIGDLLSIWLVEVPYYTDVFCQLLLISIFFETARFVIIMGIHAVGDVKWVSLISGATFMLNPFVVYLMYRYNYGVEYAYISLILVNVFLLGINIYLLNRNVNGIYMVLITTLLRILIVVSLTFLLLYYVSFFKIGVKLLDIFLVVSLSCLFLCGLSFYGIMNKKQRLRIVSFLYSKIKKNG